MQDLSDTWFLSQDDFAVDIFRQMLHEEAKMQKLCGDQHRLAYRRRIVNWMEYTAFHMKTKNGRKAQMTVDTLHLAVYLFDIFVDRFTKRNMRYYMMAGVALRLAAKLEEQELRVEEPSVLNKLPRNEPCHISPQSYCTVEQDMILLFDWHLIMPSAPQFVKFFEKVSVDDTPTLRTPPLALTSPDPFGMVISMGTDLRKLIDIHLANSLRVSEIRNVPPSLLAAATVALSRQQLGFYPRWPNTLSQISGYQDGGSLATVIGHLERYGNSHATMSVAADANMRTSTPVVRPSVFISPRTLISPVVTNLPPGIYTSGRSYVLVQSTMASSFPVFNMPTPPSSSTRPLLPRPRRSSSTSNLHEDEEATREMLNCSISTIGDEEPDSPPTLNRIVTRSMAAKLVNKRPMSTIEEQGGKKIKKTGRK